ncbi:MAG: FliO/MopB family protein [Solirubrobacterales bacterium]
MIKSILLPRAAVRAATLVLGALALAPAGARAFTPVPAGHKPSAENTPLNLTPSQVGAHTTSSGAGGPSIGRTIVGLLVVIAVIWGLSWILRQVKSGRETRSAGEGLRSVATLPLGSNRSLHLVRAGADYLLVGSAEHGVAPIHRYTEQQAREAGLVEENPADDESLPGGGAGPSGPLRRRGTESGSRGPLQMPGQGGGLLERLREWTVRR